MPTSPSTSDRAQAGAAPEQLIEHVSIGVDPHQLSATIEVVDQGEQLLGSGRFTTDRAGYAVMRTYEKTWPNRSGRSKVATVQAARWHSDSDTSDRWDDRRDKPPAPWASITYLPSRQLSVAQRTQSTTRRAPGGAASSPASRAQGRGRRLA